MVGIIGLGFVGLTTALGFASKGHRVSGFDVNEKRAKDIKQGVVPFHEPHLKEALKANLDKNFTVATSLREMMRQSEIIFFCVGTPSKKNGATDLSHLQKAIRDALACISKGDRKTFVIKSSIPPSTTKARILPLIEKSGKMVGLANNPEFLREGFAWNDFIEPDRIIIGADDKKTGEIVAALYKPFHVRMFIVSSTTAEFVKYLSNTLLAAMISFSNEMSLIANAIGGVELSKAFKILHLDKRWFGNPANMATYAFPGCGFGGYCLPKDAKGLYAEARAHGYDAKLIKEVVGVNAKIKTHVVNDIAKRAKKEDRIAILGLSFKPNSDDVRESPAYDIIAGLLKKGYRTLIAYDPLAMENFKEMYALPITYAADLDEATANADLLVILTAWEEFRKSKDKLLKKNVLDYRYMLE